MDPISFFTLAGAKTFFGRILKSKWLWISLLVIGLTTCGYFAFQHYVHKQVTTAVTDDRTNTTVQTYQAKDKVEQATQPIDQKYSQIRQHTTEDYANVRTHIQTAEPSQRQAAAPDLILDTLNDIDRLRPTAKPDGVPDTTSPVG